MKCLAIFFGLLAVLVGIFMYKIYLPFSPKLSEDSLLLPAILNTVFLLGDITDGLGIVPKHTTIDSILAFIDWTRLGSVEEDKGVAVEDTTISGVPVRIYRPRNVPLPDHGRAALIYFHGGGLVLGSAQSSLCNEMCSRFSVGAESVVISVEYRKAPEHVHPAAFEDCYAVVSEVIKESSRFGVNRNKIAVAGDSAGGLLSAAISLQLAKQNRTKDLAAQILIVPWLQSIDMTCLPSYQEYGQGFSLTREHMAYYAASVATGKSDLELDILAGNVSMYFMQTPYWDFLEIPKGSKCGTLSEIGVSGLNIPRQFIEAVVDPRLSPLLAESVEGSPPTFIASAEYDVLASEGRLFANRLKNAGVPVVQKFYKSHHGFVSNIALPFTTTQMTAEAWQDMLAYLNSVFRDI